MALHGGGYLELKKMHKGDFRGLFGIRLGRCPCIIPEKISFLQFYSRLNPNALALGKCMIHVGRDWFGEKRHNDHIHIVARFLQAFHNRKHIFFKKKLNPNILHLFIHIKVSLY